MIIVRNEKMIQRYAFIGKYAGIVAIVILVGGMYVSFKYQDQVTYSLLALIVGFTLSQIGIVLSNRFAGSPRIDQQLDNALKGLDDQYTLYHYKSAVTHFLIGPAGFWILFPYPQNGKIVYDEKRGRWKRIGGNIFMKFFGQDNIGNPAREIKAAVKQINKELGRIPEFEIPEIKTALVITGQNTEVEAENAPSPTLHAGQLKKLIRKEAKGNATLPSSTIKTIQDFYGLNSH